MGKTGAELLEVPKRSDVPAPEKVIDTLDQEPAVAQDGELGLGDFLG
jgi:hypothetical protein